MIFKSVMVRIIYFLINLIELSRSRGNTSHQYNYFPKIGFSKCLWPCSAIKNVKAIITKTTTVRIIIVGLLLFFFTRAVTGAGRQPGAGKKTGCSRVQNLNLKNFAGLNPDLCRILKSGINRV